MNMTMIELLNVIYAVENGTPLKIVESATEKVLFEFKTIEDMKNWMSEHDQVAVSSVINDLVYVDSF